MSGVLCPMLVGRDRERAKVVAAVEAARRNQGSVIVLLGEAGVGKSRVVAEAVDAADQLGTVVLAGRAVATAHPVTLRALSEALARVDRDVDPPDDPDVAPFLSALGRLVPAWRRTSVELVDPSLTTLSEGVLRLLSSLARMRTGARKLPAGDGGCLLVLEDLHWGDPETLFVLEYLADHVSAEPVCCLATVRTGSPSAAQTLARRLAARHAATTVTLPCLGPSEVDRMTRACLGTSHAPPEVEEFVRSRADGVPFFVEELLAGLIDAGALVRRDDGWVAVSRLVPAVPLTFAASVRWRLRKAGAAAAAVVAAAAVLGRRFDWAMLSWVTGYSDDVVLAALHKAVASQLLAVDRDAGDGMFRFRHALTRDVVLDGLLPPERARLAGRAARAVEAGHPGLPDGWCQLAAELFERAGDRIRAAHLLGTAARRAVTVGSVDSAEATVGRARVLCGDDPELMAELDEILLDALALAGKAEQVAVVGGRLHRSLAAAGAGRDRRADVHLRMARAAAAQGAWDDADAHLRGARQLIEHAPARQLRARADALDAYVRIGVGDRDTAFARARSALAAAEGLALPDVVCEALEVIGRGLREQDLAAAGATLEQALGVAERHGLELWRVRALAELGAIDLLDTGRVDRLEAAHDAAVVVGALGTAAIADLQLAAVLTAHLRMNEALRVADRCVALSRRLGLATLPMALIQRAMIVGATGRDDREELETGLADVVAEFGDDPEVQAGVWRARGVRAMFDADDVTARTAWDEAMRIVRRHPWMPFPFRGWWALLRTVHDLDKGAREEVRGSGTTGLRFVRASLAYADAVAAGRTGDREAALRLFNAGEATLAAYAEAGWYRQHSRRMVATAAVVDGWGAPEQWLQEALTWFEAHDHDRAASACRSVLRRAGVRVPRHDQRRAGVAGPLRALGITGREAEVLDLVAEGLTNAEIAERLYLSRRTVEKHVSSLLRRTGTRRRVELVVFATHGADTGHA